jgi:gamma-butyrobetaine dioxygenase
MTDPTIDDLLALYRSPSAQTRYDESVTEVEHALQAAALAEEAGADESLIAAALLHDVGHLLLRDHVPIREALEVDHRHEEAGADALEALFGPAVAEPVRLHVAAKRYLCAVEPGYHDRLSPASIRSLAVQGGPMTEAEAETCAARPYAEEAVRVRRWDEEAKVEGRAVPSLDNWELLLHSLAGGHQPA